MSRHRMRARRQRAQRRAWYRKDAAARTAAACALYALAGAVRGAQPDPSPHLAAALAEIERRAVESLSRAVVSLGASFARRAA